MSGQRYPLDNAIFCHCNKKEGLKSHCFSWLSSQTEGEVGKSAGFTYLKCF